MTATVAQLLAHPALAGLRRVAGHENPTVRSVRGCWLAGQGPVTWEASSPGDAMVLLSTDRTGGCSSTPCFESSPTPVWK